MRNQILTKFLRVRFGEGIRYVVLRKVEGGYLEWDAFDREGQEITMTSWDKIPKSLKRSSGIHQGSLMEQLVKLYEERNLTRGCYIILV